MKGGTSSSGRGRPARFVEACAGLGAVSLALQGGRYARPPASRPGVKAGYTTPILGAFGLHSGQGADRYTWCEPEVGLRAVLRAYADPGALDAVAAQIRAWIGQEPRPLWDRLRAEGEPAEEDAYAAARWLVLQVWSFSQRGPAHGWGGPGCPVVTTKSKWKTEQRDATIERPKIAARVEALQGLHFGRVEVFADAGDALPDDDAVGTVVYFDPSYAGLTPYLHNLARERVVALARMWHDAGAFVGISEAEPVSMGPGWEHVEITAGRHGNKRTFGDTPEWLTLNRPAVERVAVQVPLLAIPGPTHVA